MEDNKEDTLVSYETSPLKAIKKKCIECFGGSQAEVKRCTGKSCPLYPYRFGTNPYRQQKQISDEQRAELVERMKKARMVKSEQRSCEE